MHDSFAALVVLSILSSTLTVACRGGPGDPDDSANHNQRVSGDDTPVADRATTTPTASTNTTVATETAVWPSDVTALAVDSAGGGFVGPAPEGSACTLGEMHYTLEVKTLAFTSKRCASKGDNVPQAFETTSRTLTPVEYVDVEAAMKALTITKDKDGCGADKPTLGVTVTTPRGALMYYDDFYICRGEGKTYVANIDRVFDVFAKLAPLPTE